MCGKVCPHPAGGPCGYANHETFAIAVWIDNDYGAYCHWYSIAAACGDVNELAATLENADQFQVPDDLPFPLADLLAASLQSVDWHEIAGAIWTNVQEELARDQELYYQED